MSAAEKGGKSPIKIELKNVPFIPSIMKIYFKKPVFFRKTCVE